MSWSSSCVKGSYRGTSKVMLHGGMDVPSSLKRRRGVGGTESHYCAYHGAWEAYLSKRVQPAEEVFSL
jgi:hypothetical protein